MEETAREELRPRAGRLPKAYGGLNSPTQQVTPKSNVHDAISAQYESTKELHAVINVLFERLHTVLIPVPVTEDTAKDAQEPYSVTEKIFFNTRSIQMAFRRLNDMIERLEV